MLLCRRSDTGRITPVTGIVDPGEQPAVAAIREVREEADIVAEAESLVWINALEPMRYDNGDRAQYLDLVFRCRYVSGEPFPADGENTDVFWARARALDEYELDAQMRERIEMALADPPRTRFES